MSIIGKTINCVVCGKEAIGWCGHVKHKNNYIIAGWCKSHSIDHHKAKNGYVGKYKKEMGTQKTSL